MSDDKPNLDLISMVQQARMQHDAEANPNTVGGVYWIETKPTRGDVKAPTPRSGQWVIATDTDHVEAIWATVKAATEAGELGYKSKVATAPRSDRYARDSRLIAIRTYDADDTADVERVRAKLVALGITAPMTYNRDRE